MLQRRVVWVKCCVMWWVGYLGGGASCVVSICPFNYRVWESRLNPGCMFIRQDMGWGLQND